MENYYIGRAFTTYFVTALLYLLKLIFLFCLLPSGDFATETVDTMYINATVKIMNQITAAFCIHNDTHSLKESEYSLTLEVG